jgi:hypothetical protein
MNPSPSPPRPSESHSKFPESLSHVAFDGSGRSSWAGQVGYGSVNRSIRVLECIYFSWASYRTKVSRFCSCRVDSSLGRWISREVIH